MNRCATVFAAASVWLCSFGCTQQPERGSQDTPTPPRGAASPQPSSDGTVSFETHSGQHGVFTFNSADVREVLKKYPVRFPGRSQLAGLISKKAENGKASILYSEYASPILLWTLIEGGYGYKVFCNECGREIPAADIAVEELQRNGHSVFYKDASGHVLLFLMLSKV